tara:strand:+ start:23068 stop:23781 length:714 start_codon:yes stop_codon:yes gene_type:complete
MKILSIIPARGNSKSIKLKNLALLNNKPLIYYSIKQSLRSKIINRTIVSTDNKRIAKIALKYGAEVPFLRPKKISKDNSTDLDFILHTLKELQKEKYYPEFIVQLRPTQPLRKICFIDQAIKKMIKNKKADALRSISVPERSPYKMWVKNGKYLNYFVKNKIKKKFYDANRRILPKVYWHDGIIDVMRTSSLLKFKSTIGKKLIYIQNKDQYLIDIDESRDLKIANLLIKKRIIKIS